MLNYGHTTSERDSQLSPMSLDMRVHQHIAHSGVSIRKRLLKICIVLSLTHRNCSQCDVQCAVNVYMSCTEINRIIIKSLLLFIPTTSHFFSFANVLQHFSKGLFSKLTQSA